MAHPPSTSPMLWVAGRGTPTYREGVSGHVAGGGRRVGEQTVGVGRGITLAYEQLGPDDGEPLLLIAGLGMQMHMYSDEFCAELVSRGYRVIRFDNRDTGRSTHPRFRPPTPGQ